MEGRETYALFDSLRFIHFRSGQTSKVSPAKSEELEKTMNAGPRPGIPVGVAATTGTGRVRTLRWRAETGSRPGWIPVHAVTGQRRGRRSPGHPVSSATRAAETDRSTGGFSFGSVPAA